MARLDAADRATLPDTAFAYVDSRGRRRLPVHDASHVRNALARFNQVAFEDEAARDRARTRLLKAARKYRIVPVGFIAAQLRSERARSALGDPAPLPSGFVTLLMTDVEGSTALVQRLGERYGKLLDGIRALLTDAVSAAGGLVVDWRADDFFAAFETPRAGLEAAVAIQRSLRERSPAEDLRVRVRAGIHSGYPTLRGAAYIGLAVHTTARVCGIAHGGQILVSGDARLAARESAPDGVRFRSLGDFRLRGLPDPVALYQVVVRGLPTSFPPLPTATR
ncbi:MAG TPA: adenylate/guanylate cyclase domain-containing protein [Jatrophihabitantaceae bacterium]